MYICVLVELVLGIAYLVERLDFDISECFVKQSTKAKSFYTSARDLTNVDVEGAGLRHCPGGVLQFCSLTWSQV